MRQELDDLLSRLSTLERDLTVIKEIMSSGGGNKGGSSNSSSDFILLRNRVSMLI